MVGGKLAQPFAGVVQGPFQPVGGDDFVVPRSATRVHRGNHRIAGPSSELPVGVEGGLGNRRRVAALRSQGAPAFERLRPPGLDLDDHLVAVAGSLRPVPEQERLDLGDRFVPVQSLLRT